MLLLFQTVLWLVMPVLLSVVAYYLRFLGVNFLRYGPGDDTHARGFYRHGIGFCVFRRWDSALRPGISAATLAFQNAGLCAVGSKLIENAKHTVHQQLLSGKAQKPTCSVPMTATGGNVGFVGSEVVSTPSNNEVQNEIADLPAKYSGDIEVLQLVHWIPSLFLGALHHVFLSARWPRFKRFLFRRFQRFLKTFIFYRVEDQMCRYFQGLLALTALDAYYFGVSSWCLGLNAPFSSPFVAAITAWLPHLGSIGGCLLVVLALITRRAILGCPMLWLDYLSWCGCSMTLSSCR